MRTLIVLVAFVAILVAIASQQIQVQDQKVSLAQCGEDSLAERMEEWCIAILDGGGQ
jgi:hypothetical protein